MDTLVIAFLLATGKFLLILRFLPIRKVLRYDKWIDLFFTLVLPAAFYGTIEVMKIAVLSGLTLSLYLFLAKMVVGVEPEPTISRKRLHR